MCYGDQTTSRYGLRASERDRALKGRVSALLSPVKHAMRLHIPSGTKNLLPIPGRALDYCRNVGRYCPSNNYFVNTRREGRQTGYCATRVISVNVTDKLNLRELRAKKIGQWEKLYISFSLSLTRFLDFFLIFLISVHVSFSIIYSTKLPYKTYKDNRNCI